ncbi:MAG: transcriptional regulator [Legionellales bacterium]|nr:transcriptional regulator [Legionellales bacterium]
MNQDLSKVIKHWAYIAPVVAVPHNNKQYQKLISTLDELLDIVGNNEKHELIGLVDIFSHFIAEYEQEHFIDEQSNAKGVDALKFLMTTHHLTQADLPEIGSQGVVSEILNGKRSLNLRQIRALAKRFNLASSTFID